MSELTLYYHPLSSYCHKVLIALDVLGIEVELQLHNPADPAEREAYRALWPTGKMPLLVDQGRPVPETSIIIEYLQLAHPGPVRLIPDDPMAALDVRFLDRFFDLHVMTPVQAAVAGALTGDPGKQKEALAQAAGKLDLAYAWIEQELAGRAWAAGPEFTLADCAAAPALFYADWVHPIADPFPELRRYRARLLARPSFARAVDQARPYRPLFPLGAPARD